MIVVFTIIVVICIFLLSILIYNLHRYREVKVTLPIIPVDNEPSTSNNEVEVARPIHSHSFGELSDESIILCDNASLVEKLIFCMEHEQRYKDPLLSMELLAEEFGVSRSLMSDTVNKMIGKSFSDFVNSYRVEEAKRLLIETNDKMALVSRASGFGSLQSFYAVFKSYVHFTPSVYRRTYAPHYRQSPLERR